jgi:hypothetical protein
VIQTLVTPHGLPESVLRSMSEVFAAYPEVSRVFRRGSRRVAPQASLRLRGSAEVPVVKLR